MADVKISATPAGSTLTADDLFVVVNSPASGAATQKYTGTQVQTFILAGYTFAQLASKPTTLAGYGITDSITAAVAAATYSALGHTHTFASLTSKPTTLSGYGITDALALAGGTLTGKLNLPAVVAGSAPINLGQGTVNPSSPVNGDIWARDTGVFARIAGSTIGPFGAGGGAVSSVFGRTGAVVAVSGDYTFAQIGSKPTTLAGYGITDGGGAVASVFGRTGAVVATSGDYTFAQIGSKPTTIAGYGITDAASSVLIAMTTDGGAGSAVGDGVADDTAELQALINSNFTDVTYDGLGKTYKITAKLTFPDGTRRLKIQNAIFSVTGDIVAMGGVNAAALCDFCEFERIYFTCTGHTTTGRVCFDFSNFSNTIFKQVWIAGVDAKTDCFFGAKNTGGSAPYENTFDTCYLGVCRIGINFSDLGSIDTGVNTNTVVSCRIQPGVSRTGVKISRYCQLIRIIGSVFESAGGIGIETDGKYTMILGNWFESMTTGIIVTANAIKTEMLPNYWSSCTTDYTLADGPVRAETQVNRDAYRAVLFQQTADKNVDNTVTETTLWGSGVGTLTLPADFFIAGKSLEIEMWGRWNRANTAANATPLFRFKVGGTTIVTSVRQPFIGAVTAGHVHLKLLVTCRTTDASNMNLWAQGVVLSETPGVGYYPQSISLFSTAVTAIARTGTKVLDLTAQWDEANAGHQLRISNAVVKVLPLAGAGF